MGRNRLVTALALLLASQLLVGCLMPGGTPVQVEWQTGDWWSGRGMLLEVSEDRQRCRVAVRDRALFVHKRWFKCRYVHKRDASD